MGVDRLRHALEIDLDPEDGDRLQAVQTVLSRDRERRGLDLQLTDFADAERNDQQDQAGEGYQDADEDDRDREQARDADSVQSRDGRLNQECDRGSKDEGTEKVPQQKEDGDRDYECGKSEGDLRVATPALRIDRPGRGGHATDWGGTIDLFLMRGSVLRCGSHVTQTGAV